MRTSNRSGLATMLGSATVVWGMSTVAAQAQSDQDGASVLEEVVVTAQKRTQRLQDVPISIVALGGTQLEDAGTTSLASLQQFTPGLVVSNVNNGFATYTFMRGSGTSQTTAGADPSIAYFMDEVYLGNKAGLQFDLLDIERVEVLKGPQGTLFGRNAAGGAISIITRRPSRTFQGTFDARVGNYDAVTLRSTLSGPVAGSDSLFYRFSGGYRTREGFTENLVTGRDIDNVDMLTGRGQLEYSSGDVTFLLTLGALKSDNGPAARFISTADATGVLSPSAAAGHPGPGESFFKHYDDVGGGQKQDAYDVTGRLEITTPIGTLTSISAGRWSDFDMFQDNDGTGASSLALDYRSRDTTFSQEIRLSSADDTRLQWIGGLYYYRGDTEERTSLLGGPDFPSPLLRNRTAIDNADYLTESYAVFGQASYAITSQLSLTAGGRYTVDEKSMDRFIDIPGFPVPGIFPQIVHPDERWSAFNPTGTLEYKFTPDLMVYASYREGFKGGGFQALLPAMPGVPFDPETVDSYEVGFKSAWLGDKLIFNAAVFRADCSDCQVVRVIAPAVTNVDNAGEIRTDGVDISILARPSNQFRLAADMTFQHAEYRKYANPGGVDYTGNRQMRSPDFSGSLSTEYDFPIAGGATLTLHGDYSYRTKMFFDPSAAEIRGQFQDAYGLANARLTYTPGSGRWNVSLWGNNLTDEEYLGAISVSSSAAGGTGLSIAGEPRTFGVAAHLDF